MISYLEPGTSNDIERLKKGEIFMSEENIIQVEKKDHVAWLALNRPDKLNAMSMDFFTQFRDTVRDLDADKEVRALVIKAAGKCFTSGLDLADAGSLLELSGASGREELRKKILEMQECFSVLERCSKPVIAAAHGHCIGAGVDLLSACDIRVASQDAVFSIKETKLAIIADLGTLQRLPQIIGYGHFNELALTGREFSASEALQMGFVTHLEKDQEELEDKASELAREIASNSPVTVQGVKDVILYSRDRGIYPGLEYVAQKNSALLKSADLTEAITAFMENRKPEFKGE